MRRFKELCKEIVKKYKNTKLKHPVYVIQEHKTGKRVHYDLRLEFNKKLRSWAIPKEPKIRTKKYLAIETSLHPLEYANFYGKIPEGYYGAGTVKIYDKGTFNLIDKKKTKIIFEIKGRKLKGEYCLVLFKPKEESWLFFKKK